ncbi:MAG: endonuclease/exonuclease/phosphatase family protein [Alloprevotella sp.]|nr:endonuclease/exonuclease/phosphatase family protein [Alloprevotella sp.]
MKKYVLLIITLLTAVPALSQSLLVGSYNVRYQNADDSLKGNGWERRLPELCAQIEFLRPDIFGTQECLAAQLNDLQAGLPAYKHIGAGRDDGKSRGEHSAIFYRTERVRLLRSGNFWLSQTPDAPSKGWDAALPRICTWGEFEDAASRQRFFFFNLHFDHIGKQARRESARLVLEKIATLAADAPVVLTGDFNVDQHSKSYAVLAESGRLKDVFACAQQHFAPTGTFNGFDPDKHTDSRIDHIFVSPTISVENYAVLTDCYWDAQNQRRTLSDHYPVLARISFSALQP